MFTTVVRSIILEDWILKEKGGSRRFQLRPHNEDFKKAGQGQGSFKGRIIW